eukprot:TRINITY_DN7645_c0_g1_i1.p1 TRINITY_DN7645_c0_g1~~TRINITY_DN7645_c0_g1_i1.p1  ORF type:complete len:464 (-),score=92.07 TRINITY_DN7645_c0_g1_i1:18-1409(-)
MDEVDGMSAGDRGGMRELLTKIKKAKIPIICLCNDSSSTKVRSLVTHCLHLRFQRPTLLQIRGRMQEILRYHRVSIDTAALDKIITSVNGDIRQLLTLLQMWSVSNQSLNSAASVKNDLLLSNSGKDVDLGPFDALPRLVNRQIASTLTLDDKIDMYFVDYYMVPLLLQQNYASVRPAALSRRTLNKTNETLLHLDILSRAADCISDGDLIGDVIAKQQQYALLPVHAVISTVYPSHLVQGNGSRRPQFPQWLGKFSQTRKRYRIIGDAQKHASAHVSANNLEFVMDYLPFMLPPLTEPLIKEGKGGAESVIGMMDAYSFDKVDHSSMMEVGGLQNDPMKQIGATVKRHFTTQYNATHKKVQLHKSSRSTASAPKIRNPDEDEDEDDDDEDDEEGKSKAKDDDGMIKQKRTRKAKPTARKRTPTATRKRKAPTKKKVPAAKAKQPAKKFGTLDFMMVKSKKKD